jgi:hypothetical protein
MSERIEGAAPERHEEFWNELGVGTRRGRRARAAAAREVGPRVALAAVVTAVVWTGVLLLRLFAGGAVGLADQGDGHRLTCSLGVAPTQPWGVDARAHVWPTLQAQQWWGDACSAAGPQATYPSSEHVLLRAAKALTGPLGFPGALDLRALGVLCAVVVGIGLALWVLTLPGPLGHRVAVASLIGLVYADSSVAPWFVSPYAEPAAMLGILFLGPALLWLWRQERTQWVGLVTVAAVALFAATARSEAVGLVPAAVVGLVWVRSANREPGPAPARPVGRGVPWARRLVAAVRRLGGRSARFARVRGIALAVAAALVVGAGAYLHAQPARVKLEHKYDAFFGELIPHSPSGKSDLARFGLPAKMIQASGTSLSSPASVARTAGFDDWDRQVTMPKIWATYLRDPFRLVDLSTRGMHAIGAGRTNYLGNRMVGDGGAVAHDDRVPVFLTVFRAFDRVLPLLALVWVLTLGWGVAAARAKAYTPAERGLGRFAVVLVLAITGEFWWILLGGGTGELVKNMELTMLLTALCFPVILALRLTARRHRGAS